MRLRLGFNSNATVVGLIREAMRKYLKACFAPVPHYGTMMIRTTRA